MKRMWAHVLAAGIASTVFVTGQEVTPFKVGTFERQGRRFVGVVLRDAIVFDFTAASAALGTSAVKLAPVADMKDLIARYNAGVRDRLSKS